jgi:hypothetical protein
MYSGTKDLNHLPLQTPKREATSRILHVPQNIMLCLPLTPTKLVSHVAARSLAHVIDRRALLTHSLSTASSSCAEMVLRALSNWEHSLDQKRQILDYIKHKQG